MAKLFGPSGWAAGAVFALSLSGHAPPEAPVADAAMSGDLRAVEALVAQGLDVNEAQGDGMTALHWAAELGELEMAKVLIAAGADMEAVTRIGSYTPLLVAAEEAREDVVLALIEAGADPHARRRPAGTTALHFAAANGSAAAVDALVRAGAEVDARETERGQTPLMFASSENRVEAMQALLAHGAEPSLTSDVLPLPERAAQDQRAREVRNAVMDELRSEAPNPTTWVPTPAEVQVAVHASQQHDHLDVKEIRRIDWHQVQLEGRSLRFADLVGYQGGLTALLHAVREGHREAAFVLLDAGADINQPSAGDLTPPLLIALINGHFDLGLELLAAGADPTQASDAGTTPLYAVLNAQWAPKSRYPQQQAYLQQNATYLDVMEALIAEGADVNARLEKHLWFMEYTFSRLGLDSWGATPFFRAAHALDVAAMELLLQHGADPSIPTYKPAGQPQYFIDMPAPEIENLGDLSGLPPIPAGGPGVYPIHAASGFGGTQVARAGNSQRHVPDGWIPAVRFLVEELGADVNARDYLGYTPLHHAAGRGNIGLIEYLVSAGADPTAVSRSGQSAADMANGPVSLGAPPFPEVIRLLESLGATLNYDCVYC
jgi:ankyrin repeat protein